MNIRINLLPEARLQRLRNQSRKRTYTAIASLIGGSLLTVIIVFGMLQVFLLSTHATNENTISTLTKELDATREIEKSASTLQANLASFDSLNTNRTYASRIFLNLFNTIPGDIAITNFQIDEQDKMTLSGTANSFADVAKFVESLRLYNVDYKPQKDLERRPIFTDTSIASVSKDGNSGKVNFSIAFNVDGELLKKQKSEV